MENQKEENKKKIGKIVIVKVAVLLLVFFGLFVGYVFGVIISFKFAPYIVQMKYEKWMNEYLKPYKEDFTGGETPEETVDLFIVALKEGNYELASKYFVVEKQDRQYKDLVVIKEVGKGQELIDELENAKKIWHKENLSEKNIEFWYNVKEGDSSRDIGLSKNINNKWKIDSINIYYLAF